MKNFEAEITTDKKSAICPICQRLHPIDENESWIYCDHGLRELNRDYYRFYGKDDIKTKEITEKELELEKEETCFHIVGRDFSVPALFDGISCCFVDDICEDDF